MLQQPSSPSCTTPGSKNVSTKLQPPSPSTHPPLRQRIPIYLTHPPNGGVTAQIWDADAALFMRNKLRLLGDFVGTMPKHVAQSQHLSIPVVLSPEEIALGLKRGWFVVMADKPDSYAAGHSGAEAFWKDREEIRVRHIADVVENDRLERIKRLRNGDMEQTPGLEGGDVLDGDTSTALVQMDEKDCVEHTEAIAKRRKVHKRANVGAKRAREEGEEEEEEGTAPPTKRARATIMQTFLQPLVSLWQAFTAPFAKSEATNQREAAIKPQAVAVAKKAERMVNEVQSEKHVQKLKEQAFLTVPVITSTAAYETENAQFEAVHYQPEVTDRQIVFEDMHSRGYFLSCGAKFGADFLAYATSPMLVHGALMIIVVGENEELEGRTVVALGRLGDATRKRTVLAFVNGDGNVEYVGVQWEETLP